MFVIIQSLVAGAICNCDLAEVLRDISRVQLAPAREGVLNIYKKQDNYDSGTLKLLN